MHRPPRVSVIIPAFDAESTIRDQLLALRAQTTTTFEVVVADNGSTDSTAEVVGSLASELPALRLVDASQRRGVSHARNVGAAHARGDLLLICDADDVVAPQWVEAMVRGLEQHDVVGGVCEVTSLNDPQVVDWRGVPATDELPIAAGFLPYAIGATTGVRRSAFERLGGWDPRFASGGDDIDFSWRAQLAGLSLGFAPEAVVAYRYRGDLGSLWRQFYRYGSAGALLYRRYRRHGARRRPLWVTARSWAWVMIHLPDLARGPSRRGNLIRATATLCGRLAGSIRNRVLYL